MSLDKYIEIITSSCSFLLLIIFFLTIKNNSENIFFSMRSSNLMQITNLSIFLSIFCYSINDIFYLNLINSDILSYILPLYFIFQLIVFVSLLLRYHRLYISCKTTSLARDDFLLIRYFEAKSYHYEYFYVRFMAAFIFVILIASGLFYYFSGKNNIMYNYEILTKNLKLNDDNKELKGNHLFWMILSFIETFIFSTYALLIIKSYLNPKVKIPLEIILIAIINYLYFLSIGLFILKNETINKNILYIIPLLYNLLIYFVSIGLPFLWARYNDTVINYDLPGELASSLYLFLTKEKCFDLFYNFIYNQESIKKKGILYLNMLINIFKYRMLVFNEKPFYLIVEQIDNINRNYLSQKLEDTDFDSDLINQMKDACRDNRENPKINLFDPITDVIYGYLEIKFKEFMKTEKFESLKNELMQETYVRCKLANYGLIRV